MGIVVFLRKDETDQVIGAEFENVGTFGEAFVLLRGHGSLWPKYLYAVWFDDVDQRSEALSYSELWCDIEEGITPDQCTWIKREDCWESVLSSALDLYFDDVKVEVPKGKQPQLPVEVWNPRTIDSVAAWKAVQDLCKGN